MEVADDRNIATSCEKTILDFGNSGGGFYSRGGGMHVDYFGTGHVSRCTFSDNSVAGANAQCRKREAKRVGAAAHAHGMAAADEFSEVALKLTYHGTADERRLGADLDGGCPR